MIKAKKITDLKGIIDNKKIFVFDFDGVVAHTERLQWEAYNVLLKRYNVVINKETWLKYIGTSERQIYKMIKKDYHIEFDEEKMLKERFNIYLKLVKERELKPFPTFMDLLNTYTEKKFYILTSNTEEIVKDMLQNWGILNRFEKIISVVTGEKTKKDILLDTHSYFNAQRSEIAYFEDVEKNLNMASELNITTIGVEHEFNINRLYHCDAIIAGE